MFPSIATFIYIANLQSKDWFVFCGFKDNNPQTDMLKIYAAVTF